MSWFTHLSAAANDPITLALSQEPTIFSNIKEILAAPDDFSTNYYQLELIIQTATAILTQLKDITLKKIDSSSYMEGLLAFVNPLYDLLIHTEATSHNISIVIRCLYTIYMLTEKLPKPKEPYFIVLQILKYINLKTEYQDNAETLFIGFINKKSTIKAVSSPPFFLVAQSRLFSQEDLQYVSSYFVGIISKKTAQLFPTDTTVITKSFLQAIESETIPKANSISYVTFYTIILQRYPNEIQFFIEQDGLNRTLQYLLDSAPEAIEITYVTLSCIPGPGLNDTIIKFIKKHKDIPQLVHSIATLMTRFPVHEFEQRFKITKLFLYEQHNRDEYAAVLPRIYEKMLEQKSAHVNECTESVLKLVMMARVPDIVANEFFEIMSKTDPNLYELEVFFNYPNFIPFLSQCKSFLNFILGIYNSYFDPDVHWKLVNHVLTRSNRLMGEQKFVEVASAFIAAQPSQFMIEDLIRAKRTEILRNVLETNSKATQLFIDLDGLNYIHNDDINKFIKALIKHPHTFGYVSEWIMNHPEVEISTIAYDKVLMLPSLYNSMQEPKPKLSPRDAYFASKYAFNSIENKIDLANRFITADSFQQLFNSSSNISQYVDLRYDHFPLFEFTKKANDSYLAIHRHAKAVGFWVKFEENIDVTFFSSNLLTISLKDGNFATKWESSNRGKLNYTLNQWTFVYLAITSKNELFISIGDQSSMLYFQIDISTINNIIFGSKELQNPSKWYIGTTIHLFDEYEPEFTYYIQQGPGNSQVFPHAILAINPYTVSQNDQYLISCDSLQFSSMTPISLSSNKAKYSTKQLIHVSHSFSENCLKSSQSHHKKTKTVKAQITNFKEHKIAMIAFGKETSFGNQKIDKPQYMKGDFCHTVPYNGFAYYLSQPKYHQIAIKKILKSNDKDEILDILQALMNANKIFPKDNFDNELLIILKDKFDYLTSLYDILLPKYLYDLDLWVMAPGKMTELIKQQIFDETIMSHTLTSLYMETDLKFELIDAILFVPDYFGIYNIFLASEDDIRLYMIDKIIQMDIRIIKSIFKFENVHDLVQILPKDTSLALLKLVAHISASDSSYIRGSKYFFFAFLRHLDQTNISLLLFAILNGSETFDYSDKLEIKRVQFLSTILSFIFSLYTVAVNCDSTKFLSESSRAMSLMSSVMPNSAFLQSAPIKSIVQLGSLPFNFSTFSTVRNVEADSSKINTEEFDNLLFNAWKVPLSLFEFTEMVPTFPNSISPLFSLLAPYTTKFDDTDFVPDRAAVTFYKNIIMNVIDKPQLLQEIIDSFVLQPAFASELILMIFSTRLSTVPVEILTILLNFVINQHFENSMVFTSIFTLLNSFFNGGKVPEPCIYPIRMLFLRMFFVIKPEQLLTTFEYFSSFSDFLYKKSGIFHDTEFASIFMLKARENPDLFKMLSKVISHKKNYTIKNNKYQFIQKVSTLETRFMYLSEHYQTRSQNIQAIIFKLSYLLHFLASNFINGWFREMENITLEKWLQHQIQLDPKTFEAKSYHLSPLVWPIMCPRVLAPSKSPLPSIEYNQVYKIDNFYKEPHKTSPFQKALKSKTYSLYPIKLHEFAYSNSTINDSNLLLINFLNYFSQYGPLVSMHCVTILRHNTSCPSVMFVFNDVFLLLLNATSEAMRTLKLIEDTPSHFLYMNFLETFALRFWRKVQIFCGHFVLVVPFNSIAHFSEHYWYHEPNARDIFQEFSSEIILHSTEAIPKLKKMSNNEKYLFNMSLTDATYLWSRKMLSNQKYLLVLNSYGGRSFADLSQYPVFPWVHHRDLTKPMGQQTQGRFPDDLKEYGSHYSMAPSIIYFLERVPPFTYYNWDFHRGRENQMRSFLSIKRTWQMSSKESGNDVKELTPEFFEYPEFLNNENNINKPVELPKWAQNPAHYIMKNRMELEQANNIEKWIDLIFGYAQVGKAAEQNKNIFMKICYHQIPIDEKDINEEITTQLENWGQCPKLLFYTPHVSKAINITPKLSKYIYKRQLSNSVRPIFSLSNSPKPDNNEEESEEECTTFLATKPRKPIISQPEHPRWLMLDIMPTKSKFCISKSEQNLYMLTHGNPQLILNDSRLALATNVSLSNDEVFLCVDFENASTVVYRIRHQGGKRTEFMGIFTFTTQMRSCIDSTDYLCASFDSISNCIYIWDFVRVTLHRRLFCRSIVVDCCFDEEYGLLYVATENELVIYTINGSQLTTLSLDEKPVKVAVNLEHAVYVVFSSGIISQCKYSTETNTLETQGMYQIILP